MNFTVGLLYKPTVKCKYRSVHGIYVLMPLK